MTSTIKDKKTKNKTIKKKKDEIDKKKEEILTEEEKYYNNSKYNLVLKESTIKNAGLGVFTLEKILSKEFVGYYDGIKKTRKKSGLYYFEINNKIGIDAEKYPRCYMAMINDIYNTNNKVNCEFILDEKKQLVEIWSIIDIDENSELFISYGNDYWSNK
jgi:hypothetical protein